VVAVTAVPDQILLAAVHRGLIWMEGIPRMEMCVGFVAELVDDRYRWLRGW
jgi:hypothetical protein